MNAHGDASGDNYSGNKASGDRSHDGARSQTDLLLEEFAGRWSTIRIPRIDDFLDRVDSIERSNLLRGLLQIKRHELAKYRSVPSRREYHALFPDDVDVIDEALAAHATTNTQDDAPGHVSIDSTMDASLETVGQINSEGVCDWPLSPGPSNRFRILRDHAKGGLGQVSVALDTELDREVALKEIQPQFALDDDCRSRFLLEAQVTGGLEHPGIVPVYGLNCHPDGRPFYAMRFIRGETLKEAADAFHQPEEDDSGDRRAAYSSVEFRQLLNRFIDVCNAIEYAHSRGVLHRDLKPGNVMLGGFGETLVVDWGLAKVRGKSGDRRTDDESTLNPSSGRDLAGTQSGSALGTPAFMPPEQAAGKLDELGPASDVYSLGATLFYVLTGKPPVKGRDVDAVLSGVIRGDIPSPKTIRPEIPRPLQAICEKALSRVPEDRYRQPMELAGELEKWLADEPVMSCADPIGVKLRRWLRKHPRTAASLAASLLIGLSSAIVISAIVSVSNRKLTIANTAEQKARGEVEENARQLATANTELTEKEAEVRRERDVAVVINEFVRNDLLGQASPEQQPDREIKLSTVLDRAAAAIGDRFKDKPLVEAAISLTVGKAYHDLGDYESAESFLLRARELRSEELGEEHRDTISSMGNLASLYKSQGRYEEAETLHSEELALSRRVLGEEHPDTLIIMNNQAGLYEHQGRYDEAVTLLEATLETSRRELGFEDPCSLACLNNLASLYETLGRYGEAKKYYEEALDISDRLYGEEHPKTLAILNNFAYLHKSQNRYDEAGPMYERTLKVRQRVLGEEHPDTLTSMNNLAGLYDSQGRKDKAEPLYVRALELSRRVLGEEHPYSLTILNNVAYLYKSQGRNDEAELMYAQALALFRRSLGEQHPTTLASMNNLALLYLSMNRLDEAEPLLLELLQESRLVFGDQHPETLRCINNLSTIYAIQGEHQKALSYMVELLSICQTVFGADHPNTLSTMKNLASLYWNMNRMDQSVQLYEQLLSIQSETLAEDHPDRLSTQLNLAMNFHETGQLDKAISLLESGFDNGRSDPNLHMFGRELLRAYTSNGDFNAADAIIEDVLGIARKALPSESNDLAQALDDIGTRFLELESWERAEQLFLESLEIRQNSMPLDWRTSRTQSLLGSTLSGQARFAEAEPLLITGFEATIERMDQIPRIHKSLPAQAVRRIIDLYDRWDKMEKAMQWRTKLVELKRELGIVDLPEAGVRPPFPNKNGPLSPCSTGRFST